MSVEPVFSIIISIFVCMKFHVDVILSKVYVPVRLLGGFVLRICTVHPVLSFSSSDMISHDYNILGLICRQNKCVVSIQLNINNSCTSNNDCGFLAGCYTPESRCVNYFSLPNGASSSNPLLCASGINSNSVCVDAPPLSDFANFDGIPVLLLT